MTEHERLTMLQDGPRFQLALDRVSTWEPRPMPPDWHPAPIEWTSPQARHARAALIRRMLERRLATAPPDRIPYADEVERPPRRWFRTGGR